MKKILVVTIILTLLVTAVAGVACAKKEGELPTLKVGNQWVYKAVWENVDYEVTVEVTGADTVNGKDCYVTTWDWSPALYGIVNTMTMRIDKATFQALKGQMTGSLMGLPYSLVTESSYTFPESPYWPLEVGKEIKVTEASTTTTTAMGETETETETKTSTYKVESVEEITVAAGTFKCFKVVEYDETGNKLFTSWHSDKVKNDVKFIDHENGDTVELKSYSV